MTHVIKTPSEWENISELQDILSKRFKGDSFRFIFDNSIDRPVWHKSFTPPEFVITEKESGLPCNFPAIDEINDTIIEFVENNRL